jgi:hypothetical protein
LKIKKFISSNNETNFLNEIEERSLDVVIDCIGNEKEDIFDKLLKDTGILVDLVNKGSIISNYKKKLFSFFATQAKYYPTITPNTNHIENLIKMKKEGKLDVNVENVYSIKNITNVHMKYDNRMFCGKLIISVYDEENLFKNENLSVLGNLKNNNIIEEDIENVLFESNIENEKKFEEIILENNNTIELNIEKNENKDDQTEKIINEMNKNEEKNEKKIEKIENDIINLNEKVNKEMKENDKIINEKEINEKNIIESKEETKDDENISNNNEITKNEINFENKTEPNEINKNEENEKNIINEQEVNEKNDENKIENVIDNENNKIIENIIDNEKNNENKIENKNMNETENDEVKKDQNIMIDINKDKIKSKKIQEKMAKFLKNKTNENSPIEKEKPNNNSSARISTKIKDAHDYFKSESEKVPEKQIVVQKLTDISKLKETHEKIIEENKPKN